MFYDLNIIYDKNNTTSAKEAVNMAGQRYNVVALNYIVKGKTASSDVSAITKFTYEPDAAGHKPPGASVEQRTRLTLILDDNAQQMILSYDIVAVQPGTDALLLKCVQSPDIDIITFDFTQRLPFNLKPAVLSQAVDHGIYFEVPMAQMLKGDPLARRIFISNVTQLVKVARGKNILFTSGSGTAMNLRAPYDLINVGTMFGIEPAAGKKTLTLHPRSVVYHAYTRQTQKGVLDVVNIADVPEKDRWMIPNDPVALMSQPKKGARATVEEDVASAADLMDVDERPATQHGKKPQQQQKKKK